MEPIKVNPGKKIQQDNELGGNGVRRGGQNRRSVSKEVAFG